MVAIINNGQLSKKSFVLQAKKQTCENILNLLWDEGFILGYRVSKTNPNKLQIFLNYKNGHPSISLIKILSKPSLKLYYSVKQIWKLESHKGTIIFSTNKGLLSIQECKKLNVGGEPILVIK